MYRCRLKGLTTTDVRKMVKNKRKSSDLLEQFTFARNTFNKVVKATMLISAAPLFHIPPSFECPVHAGKMPWKQHYLNIDCNFKTTSLTLRTKQIYA